MSRSDYPKAAQIALDRNAVPALSAGFADRVVAAAIASGAAMPPLANRGAPRRDRRGLWRRAGQAAIGVAAFGMMSAAAVASGLLGAVGIEVPVLTAMLAPQKAKPVPEKKTPVRLAAKAKPVAAPATAEALPPASLAADPERPPWQQAMMARRAANEARRNAFVDAHPGLREAIAAGPEARKAYMAQHPEVRDEVRARRIEAQTRRAAVRAAMIQRRRARLGDAAAGPRLEPIDPAMRAAMAERRHARLAEFRAMDPETRARRIEAIRARREARRAMRKARGADNLPADEGSALLAR